LERLDKFLAERLMISRKDARALVRSGAVFVGGIRAHSGDQKLAEDDEVTANGKALSRGEFVYYMMNKPAGVLSATRDPNGETVLDLLPEGLRRKGLFPAGRLDKDTEGFVMLTNDGALAHRILSPKNHIPKTYFARVEGSIPPELPEAFAAGVILGNGDVCKPAILEVLGENEARVIITEGMYHQIKRMFNRYGLSVVYLRREKIGGLSLDAELPLGGVREITPEEIMLLKE
jgi:16S rRNA pseudouridine516 synthase